MDNYSVMMSAAAAEDIGSIADYIANTLLEPETAAKLIGRLKTAVKSLETMPERHPLVADTYLALRGIRTLLVDNYCVFYAAECVSACDLLYSAFRWKDDYYIPV